MVTAVSRDQILNAMVIALGALVPVAGDALTSMRPVYSSGRYTGKLSLSEMLQDGSGGRMPALQVAFEGERREKTTIGRRVDRVRGTYTVHVITDNRTSRDARSEVLAISDLVRQTLAAHQLGLAIRPLEWVEAKITVDVEAGVVYSTTFSTLYRTDYTKTGPFDLLESASGDITNEDGSTTYGDIAVTLNQENS